jgi:O-antigen/teichoic acid export membrane protein
MENNGLASFANTFYRWGLKGGLGILDQAIFSGANFFISIFLARWLSKEDFGEFAIGFAVLTFFVQVYTSFTLEPMSVLGPSGYRGRIASYLLGQVRLLFLLSVPTSLLLGLIIWLDQFIGNRSVAASILIFSAISLPFILFPLLMRRVFYVLLKPGLALLGSVVYFLGLIFIFYLAMQYDALNGVNSILIISVAGLLSGLTLLLFLQNENSASDRIELITILVETWSFGKWLIVSGVFIGLATQSQIYLTGLLSNIEDAGAVRILQTFIQPMMLTATAFSALATPAITADFASGAYDYMRRKIFLFTVLLGGIALFYECLLVLFSGRLNQFLFEGKYLSYTNQIPIWGFIPVLLAFFWGGAISLQASQKPQAMLIISGTWAFFSIVPGLIVIPMWGAWGATISIVSGFVAAFASTWILYWFWVYRIYIDDKR